MLGYIAENLLTGFTENIQWYDVKPMFANGDVLLDVRTANEFANGAIAGAINIPLDEIRDRFDEIPNGKIIVYCQVGQRGHTATVLLRERGINAVNLDGGYKTWLAAEPLT
jgi:rhodanese-related sulfurtransferase